MSPKHLFDFVSRCLHEDLFHVAVYSSPGIATRVPFPHSAWGSEFVFRRAHRLQPLA